MATDLMVTVRQARPDDAADLARLINQFNVEEDSPGRITELGVRELCFVRHPRYRTLVAEDGDALVGYALTMRFFDTEPCTWCCYMQDLFVIREKRSLGVGRRLIAAVAQTAIAQGDQGLFWHVRARNHRGRAFYASIGAKERTPLPVALTGEALAALARTAG